MGVSTKGYINNDIKWGDVYQYIKENIDDTATHDFRNIEGIKTHGDIIFKYKGENKTLFFCSTRDIIEGTEYDGSIEHGNLILCSSEYSVELMQEIVAQFGGYVDDNNCDTINAYYIPKVSGDEFATMYETRKQIESILSGDSIFKTNCAMAIMENFDIIKTIIEKY